MNSMLIFVFLLCCLCYLSEALRWTKSGINTVSTATVFSLMNVIEMPEIDVSSGVQTTIIRNSKTYEKGISIYCFVSGFDNDTSTQFSFCKENNDCHHVTDGVTIKINNFYNFDITLNANVTNKKGVKIWLQLFDNKMDYSGSYFCKAKNNNFEIRSNIIEVRDKIFWGQNMFSNINYQASTSVQLISLETMPQVLRCSDGASKRNPGAPDWTKAEFPSPVQWSVCPVFKRELALNTKAQMTLARCATFSKDKCDTTIEDDLCPKDIDERKDWSTFVNQDGDLLFTDLQSQSSPAGSRVDSYSFMCYIKDQMEVVKPLFYFYNSLESHSLEVTKGIVLDSTSRPQTWPALVRISDLVQEFVLYARQVPSGQGEMSVKPVAIYALFRGPPDASFKWRHGNVILNTNNQMTVSRYMVTFPRDVTSNQAGKYTLEVVDKSVRILFTINVRVLGPPMLVFEQCLVPLSYVWAGEGASFSCEYNQRPSEIKLQINGQDIMLGDSLDNSKANLKKSNPYLERLNFSLSPAAFVEADSVTVSYKVYNLTKTLGQSHFQDHTVTFMASNNFGISVKTVSIYVVPHVRTLVDYFPERDNCTDPCSSSEIHRFQCKVRVQEYGNKELSVDYYWSINSNRLGQQPGVPRNMFTPYFQVDPFTKELTMLPIKSDNDDNDKVVKNALKNNFIECNVDLKSTTESESPFFYRSSSDKSLANSMKAKITLDYEPINTAFVYWIVAVILGLIVLIILLILLIRYCMKNKGETYPLDKLERQHGYDPDKEVQDELFKPYERQEHDPETGPGSGDERRLSITGNSVGSYDDGELDTYDLDPSNFNEDGSIIGKYGANPRGRAPRA